MGKSESIIASYRSEVEAHLTSHMETLHGPIYDPARYLLEVGGKRIRPCLLLAAVEAFGGSRATAMNEAIAIEIFHNFTLLHDDVMDDADTRRGRPVVHIKWNESQAILTGDIMFAISYDLLMDKKNEAISMDILRLFNRTASEVCIGQQMDMDFEQRDDVRVNEYLEMIRLKTSVLLGASMGMGAMLAGADSKNVHAIYDYALNVGMAFQMQDDYLDAFGDMDKVGKRVGGDIIRNKKTILLLNALNMAQSDDKKRLPNVEKRNTWIRL